MELNDNIKIISPPSVTVKKRTADYLAENPHAVLTHLNQSVMNMPLPKEIVDGMKMTIDEISNPHGMILTSPWDGYSSLKHRITVNYTSSLGVSTVRDDEVIVTGGIESALSSVSDLFGAGTPAVLPDPCEIYLRDMHRIAGRSIRFMKAVPENNFLPMPDPNLSQSIIFISNPNLITGVSYTRDELKEWVDAANRTGSVIVYNSSLSLYLESSEYPRSIYEIPEARDCAIEIFSFGEGFGVPELKVAYTVIPNSIVRENTSVASLYHLRQHSNATPPSYIMQKAAEMILSPENKAETEKIIRKIKKVGKILSEKLLSSSIPNVGNATSPFVWAQCPEGLSSWRFFDMLLSEGNIVVTPGSLYGSGGEGYFRITSFGLPEEAFLSAQKIAEIFTTSENTEPEPADIIG